MPDINILVVDDEKEIADLIEIYLATVAIAAAPVGNAICTI